MEQLMVISAIGSNKIKVVLDLTKLILDCGGSITESRMTALGDEFAMLLLVSGNWHSMSRMEQDLERLAETNELIVQVRRTEPKKLRKDLLPYAIDLVCLDQPGIVHKIAQFLAQRNIELGEVTTRGYTAARTDTPMFSVHIFINIPTSLHLSTLRQEFIEFCDRLNFDAVLEPVKTI